jgi:hypothetical protein
METMGQCRVRIPVCGLQSVLRNTGDEITENKIKFNYRIDQEIVGDVRVDKEKEEDTRKEPMYWTRSVLYYHRDQHKKPKS